MTREEWVTLHKEAFKSEIDYMEKYCHILIGSEEFYRIYYYRQGLSLYLLTKRYFGLALLGE